MTANQRKAVTLAEQLLRDERSAAGLNDAEWGLLLLAAGLNSISTRPGIVAGQVMRNLASGSGYFLGQSGSGLTVS